MLTLELSKANATLDCINLRTEKIGPEKVPSADLKIACPCDSDVLAHFSPTLKSFLFDLNGPQDLAGGVPLRDPHLQYPLSRDEEMTGATFEVAHGVGSPMIFEDCRINAFKLTPMEGGTVVVTFRVQCRPTPAQVGKLYLMQEAAIEVTLTPAELPTMREAA